jgi:hypothetical protein
MNEGNHDWDWDECLVYAEEHFLFRIVTAVPIHVSEPWCRKTFGEDLTRSPKARWTWGPFRDGGRTFYFREAADTILFKMKFEGRGTING